jgi:hypothetical protein
MVDLLLIVKVTNATNFLAGSAHEARLAKKSSFEAQRPSGLRRNKGEG